MSSCTKATAGPNSSALRRSEGDTATARFDSERASLDGEISRAAESLDAARGRTDELEALLAELRQSSSAAHDRRGQIEVERARIESEAEHLARACYSELAMSLEDVVTSVELGLAAQNQLAGQGQQAESRRISADIYRNMRKSAEIRCIDDCDN